MTEDRLEEDNGPVFVAYSMEDLVKSPRELYKSVKEVVKYVNSPEGKSISARFKKFGTPREARDFLSYGDVTVGNSESEFPMPSEAKSPFSSLSLPQMSEFKRYIEKGDVANFMRLVEENPRFLVNTGGDVASILLAGCRYNALHISAKAGQAEITRKIIELIGNTDFLMRLYGTSKEDVVYRRNNIIKSYLNTPDKGNLYTPLHFATIYGKLDVVKVLGQQRLLDRRIRNKMGKTPMESACERYSEADKAQVQKGMELALEGYYIFLTRDINGISQLTTSQLFTSSESPSAVAGPFSTDSEANEFRNKWQVVGKEVKRSDFDKGYEKVGRLLAESEGVGWAETWRFLEGMAPIDVTSDEGLGILETFLRRRQIDEIRNGQEHQISKELTSHVRRALDFDILDDKEDVGSSGDHVVPDDVENSDDEFYDTFTEPHDFDDTLGSLTDRFASLSVVSPKRQEDSEVSEDVRVSEDVDSDDDDFVTPPTTPPPVFVIDEAPCKIDNDLFEVLSSLPRGKLDNFPLVSKYVSKLSNLTPSDRLCWPSLDSPRRAHFRSTKKY